LKNKKMGKERECFGQRWKRHRKSEKIRERGREQENKTERPRERKRKVRKIYTKRQIQTDRGRKWERKEGESREETTREHVLQIPTQVT